MTKYLQFGFGVVAYLLFFAVFLYLIGFTGDLLVPRSVDRGPEAPFGLAVAVNVALIALFGVQHSVMARPGFKQALARAVPPVLERSVYVMATNLVLIALFVFWLPIPAPVWTVEAEWARILIWAVFAAGWAMVFISTWLLNHFELFGLHQHWLNIVNRAPPPPTFRQPLFYKYVRHPLYLGFLLAFWATPTMTLGHLLFAAGMSVYILIAIGYEERDLVAAIGSEYSDYRRRVGMLLPGLGRARD